MAICTKVEKHLLPERLLIITKQTARNLRIFCIFYLPYWKKRCSVTVRTYFFSKHLVSFLVILTGGTTFVCEVRLSFKYSNGRLTNVILNDVWTAPSPKEKKRKTFVEAPTYYKATCSEFPQTVNPQVSLPFWKGEYSVSFSDIQLTEFCSPSAPSEFGGQRISKNKRMLSMNWTVLHPVTNIWQHQSPPLVDLGKL